MIVSLRNENGVVRKQRIVFPIPDVIEYLINGHMKYVALYIMIENNFNPPKEFVCDVLVNPHDIIYVDDVIDGYINPSIIQMYRKMEQYPVILVFCVFGHEQLRSEFVSKAARMFGVQCDGKFIDNITRQIGVLLRNDVIVKQDGNYILNL